MLHKYINQIMYISRQNHEHILLSEKGRAVSHGNESMHYW